MSAIDLQAGERIANRYELIAPYEDPIHAYHVHVWRVADTVLGRELRAIIIPSDHPYRAEAIDAARRMGMYEDSSAVAILTVIDDDTASAVLTEFPPGYRLDDYLVKDQPWPAHVVTAMMGEACSAINHARNRGLRHLQLSLKYMYLADTGELTLDGIALLAALGGVKTNGLRSDLDRSEARGLLVFFAALLEGEDFPADPEAHQGYIERAAGRSDLPDRIQALFSSEREGRGPDSPADILRRIVPWGEISIQDIPALAHAIDADKKAAEQERERAQREAESHALKPHWPSVFEPATSEEIFTNFTPSLEPDPYLLPEDTPSAGSSDSFEEPDSSGAIDDSYDSQGSRTQESGASAQDSGASSAEQQLAEDEEGTAHQPSAHQDAAQDSTQSAAQDAAQGAAHQAEENLAEADLAEERLPEGADPAVDSAESIKSAPFAPPSYTLQLGENSAEKKPLSQASTASTGSGAAAGDIATRKAPIRAASTHGNSAHDSARSTAFNASSIRSLSGRKIRASHAVLAIFAILVMIAFILGAARVFSPLDPVTVQDPDGGQASQKEQAEQPAEASEKSTPAQTAPTPPQINSVTFVPADSALTDDPEAARLFTDAPRVADADPETVFQSWYFGSQDISEDMQFGLMLTLKEKTKVSSVVVSTLSDGGTIQWRNSSADDPIHGEVVAEGEATASTQLDAPEPIETDTVVVWITRLPVNQADGKNRITIPEISVK